MSEMVKRGGYWKNRLSKKYKALQNRGKLTQFRINGLSRGIDIAYEPYSTHPVGGGGVNRDKTLEVCKLLFPRGIIPNDLAHIAADSELGSPVVHDIRGVKVTVASLKYTYITDLLRRQGLLASGGKVVWEIGSGYGGQARALLLLDGIVENYISQDFPEHIIIQRYFLREFKDRVWWIGPNISPPEPVDIVVCTYAFMEMSKDEVTNYFDLIRDNLKVGGHLYTIDDMNKMATSAGMSTYPIGAGFEKVWEMPFPDYGIGKVGKQWLFKKVA
jgi:hypothetical protein